MSSRAAKLARHGVVRISARPNQHWHSFTLQKGHLFGQDAKGYFVSAAEPGYAPGTIKVYRTKPTSSQWREFDWYQTIERTDRGTGAAILKKAAERKVQAIEYESVERSVKAEYNPPLTAAMPDPATCRRITGGSAGPRTAGYVRPGWVKRNPNMKDDSPAAFLRERGYA